MKNKDWKGKDCPICGSKGTMRFRKGLYDEFTFKGYPPIRIGPLAGYFCEFCKDGFLRRVSERLIEAKLQENRARCDAATTTAGELMSVSDAVKTLKTSRQWVHKLMRDGKIDYVFIGDLRFPKRESVLSHRMGGRVSALVGRSDRLGKKTRAAAKRKPR